MTESVSNPINVPTETTSGVLNKKPWIIVGIVVLILLVLTIALATMTILLINKQNNLPSPSSSIVEQSPVLPNKISKFASDSAILELGNRAKKIMIEIDSVDLIEPEISPPSLDLNIRLPI